MAKTIETITTGVYLDKHVKKKAYFVRYKGVYVGTFHTEEEALQARQNYINRLPIICPRCGGSGRVS